ncbi:hypothetical protein [Pseudomonas sp. EMN2]|uniref:hypothetical protein n=1 Tax=Pseudomonas sp. EMN2 TaxID=2615212 RepID=UPI00129A2415|nr:hypothetical protein [Pseudomonas sp. EMN2]
MKQDLAAENTALNEKQGINKRWWLRAMFIGTAVMIAAPVGALAGMHLVEWATKSSVSTEAPILQRAAPGTSRNAACNGDEFFCASLASSNLKDTIQALAANLPTGGRYRVTLKVEQEVDDYELMLPPLRAPLN